MSRIKVIVHGLGNIGKGTIAALETASDMQCLGVIRRAASLGSQSLSLRGLQDFADLESLISAKGKPDVAIICGPSRNMPDDALLYLEAGINTVDCFDIHSEVPLLVERLGETAKKAGRVAVVAAGWDPGTDSVLRVMFEAMAPVGTTFTNFGRGRSMGHTVAARGLEGVANAVSITIPIGGGRHSRLVYVLPAKGAAQADIKARLAKDDYFAHDPLDVRFVASEAELSMVADNSHGVLIERIGASGLASNQHLSFDMRIDNPALTSQILVSCARASTRLAAGSYTMIDIPPVSLLAGERMSHVARLV